MSVSDSDLGEKLQDYQWQTTYSHKAEYDYNIKNILNQIAKIFDNEIIFKNEWVLYTDGISPKISFSTDGGKTWLSIPK